MATKVGNGAGFTETEADSVFALVRLRRGVVGETRRTCHLVLITVVDRIPGSLTTLCGEQIFAGQADLLADPVGMPCERCLTQVAIRSTSSRSDGNVLEFT
jgi:hypothetical protein